MPSPAVLSAALMLDELGHAAAAAAVEEAVRSVSAADQTTPDLGGTLTTAEVGDRLAERVAAADAS